MIALGCDHGGFNLISAIKEHFDEQGIAYKDFPFTPARLQTRLSAASASWVFFAAARESVFPWQRTRSRAFAQR